MSYRVNDIENLLAVIDYRENGSGAIAQLEPYINDLINTNFDQLLQLLYRLDVDEKKIRTMLENNAGTDAARIISTLIIERQIQKKKSREQFSQRDDNISEEDKW